MHVRPFMFALTLLSAPAVTAADAWDQFRGAGARGMSVIPGGPGSPGDSVGSVPAQWGDDENLAWKTDLPGAGSSSPVVLGNRIFLTAYSGYGMSVEEPGEKDALQLHVLCLSLDDGQLMWDRAVDPSPDEQPMGKRIGEHGFATPTPCLDHDNVYASFGPSGVVAFSQNGEFLWRCAVGSKTAGFGAAASPIVFEDLVIMNASIEDDAVYGIDKNTGEIRWRTDGIERAWTTPTIVTLADGSAELVVNQKGAILGLDPRTGERLWSCEAIQDYIVPSVIADGERLYCSGGRENKTFVIRAGGRGDVTESHLVWEVSRGANVTTPLLHDGYLYWSHDKAIALCLRASDGEEMFRERLPTRGRVYASIVADGDKLFLTTRDAGVVVLAAKPRYEELAVNRLGDRQERFNATPAISGGKLLLRSDKAIYCVADRSTR